MKFNLHIYTKAGKVGRIGTAWSQLDRFVVCPDPDGWLTAEAAITRLRYELTARWYKHIGNKRALDAFDQAQRDAAIAAAELAHRRIVRDQ